MRPKVAVVAAVPHLHVDLLLFLLFGFIKMAVSIVQLTRWLVVICFYL
jgi:hypothetical protein